MPHRQSLLHGDESDFMGPKIVHWHGATPDQHAVFATVAFGGATQWLDKVPESSGSLCFRLVEQTR
jgi:hypothetical protein